MAERILGHVKSGQIQDEAVLVIHLSDEVKDYIDAEGLKAEEVLSGTNIVVTDNGDGTITLATTDDITVDSLTLATDYTSTGSEVTGTLYWSEDDRTASLVLKDDVVLQLGKEQFINITNQTGSDIDDGTVIAYASGIGASGKIEGQLGIADGSILPQYILGIATCDIADGEDGEVTTVGKVRGLNTTGSLYGEDWSEGDVLFVSPSIAGGLTNVQPIPPNRKVPIAVVVNKHAINGTLFVRTTFVDRIRGLDDVTGTDFDTDGQILSWNQTSQVFETLQLVVSNVPHTIYTASVSAGDEIPSTYDVLRLSGNAGAVTLTSTPTISTGQHDGQVIRIFGGDGTNTITLQDESSLTGSTLRLPGGSNVTLGEFDNIQVMWNESQSVWVACSPVVTI